MPFRACLLRSFLTPRDATHLVTDHTAAPWAERRHKLGRSVKEVECDNPDSIFEAVNLYSEVRNDASPRAMELVQ